MSAAELVVELVLTGLLLLCALLMPAVAAGALPFELSEGILALAIAAGFVLGVVIDRCADTLLARWEGRLRCRFAWDRSVPAQRRRLVGASKVADPFPENWMRIEAMCKGGEGVQHALEQLRVRIRVARAMVILTPALATSATLTIACAACTTAAVVAPVLHVAFLLAVVLVSEWKGMKQPHTRRFARRAPISTETNRWLVCSPASLWFALQGAAGLVIVYVYPGRRLPALGSLALGVVVTALAASAWSRIQGTYMGFLWNYCRFQRRNELIPACAPGASPSLLGRESGKPESRSSGETM